MNTQFINNIANGGVPIYYDDLKRIEISNNLVLSQLYNLMTSTSSETDNYKNGIVIYGCNTLNIIGTQAGGTCDITEGYIYFRCDETGNGKNDFGFIAKYNGGSNITYPFYMVPSSPINTSVTFEDGTNNTKLETFEAVISASPVNGVGTYFKPWATRTLSILNKRASFYNSEIKQIADSSYNLSDTDVNAYFKSNGKGLRSMAGWQIANGNNNSVDIKTRTLVQYDPANGDSIYRNIGNIYGAKTHALAYNEMPDHSHRTVSVGGVYGVLCDGGGTTSSTDNSTNEINVSYPYRYSNYELNQRYTSNVGGGVAHNNNQPSFNVMMIEFIGVDNKTD